jgi:hypothetical protein
MEQYLVNEREVRRSSRVRVFVVTLLGLALLALLLFAVFRLVQWLWTLAAA